MSGTLLVLIVLLAIALNVGVLWLALKMARKEVGGFYHADPGKPDAAGPPRQSSSAVAGIRLIRA